jgi:hypothetical protein
MKVEEWASHHQWIKEQIEASQPFCGIVAMTDGTNFPAFLWNFCHG